jgi:glycosyltransferase involved in cell wall biosynthesis
VKRVAVLTEDPAGPSARHRFAYPAAGLRAEGFDVSLHPVEPRAARPAAFAAAGEADITVVHRKLFRLPDVRRLRRAAGTRIVFDLDDAVMFRAGRRRRQWSILRAWRFARMVRTSRLFLAGNSYLASRASRWATVVLRPTPVDIPRYAPRGPFAGRGRVVGWVGTAATLPYLRGALPALRTLAARRPDLTLRVIGPEPEGVTGLAVEHVPFVEETEAAALRDLDVGILPLPDDPWTRGKCAFKGLLYMACGLPVVASPTGMNSEAVADGETGFLAATDAEFADRIERLLDDPGLRTRFGAAGRRRVEERYSNDVLTPKLARVLRSLFP